jgi:hypothetical protein
MAFSNDLVQDWDLNHLFGRTQPLSNLDQLRNIDQLRQRQEQRLLPVLECWDAAKKNLENALALAETREREFREVQEDVRRNLDALVLVIGMTKELATDRGAEDSQPIMMVPENVKPIAAEEANKPEGLEGFLRRSSRRPLFSSLRRSA